MDMSRVWEGVDKGDFIANFVAFVSSLCLLRKTLSFDFLSLQTWGIRDFLRRFQPNSLCADTVPGLHGCGCRGAGTPELGVGPRATDPGWPREFGAGLVPQAAQPGGGARAPLVACRIDFQRHLGAQVAGPPAPPRTRAVCGPTVFPSRPGSQTRAGWGSRRSLPSSVPLPPLPSATP